MERLLEHEIYAAVLGETSIQDHLDKISIHNGMGSDSYSDCEEYIICPVNCCEDPYFSALFKITDSIKKRWKEKKLDLRVYLYLKDLKIVGGHIFKYRNTDISGYFGHSGYETDPCQQEIRIVSRMLNYLLKK